MMRNRSLSMACVVLAFLWTEFAYAVQSTESAHAKDVQWYFDLYPSSVIRSMRFADQPDPEASVREEIYLEARLAKLAEEAGLTTNTAIQADIAYYQDSELIDMWLRHKVAQKPVTEAEIEQEYAQNASEFTETGTVRFRHLFLMVPPNDSRVETEKKVLAEKILRQVQRGAEFANLVAEYSELKDAKRNKGVVGPEIPDRLGPQVRQALLALKENEITGPIRTRYGWEILQLLERKEPRVRPLTEVKSIIRRKLEQARSAEYQKLAEQTLPKAYPANVNDAVLSGTAPLSPSDWCFAVAGTTFTVAQTLAKIRATWSYENISDERERIRAALPRLILTEQVKAAARADGLADSEEYRAKARFIQNRLLAENYLKKLPQTFSPSEKELRDYYEAEKQVFQTPPEGKGIVFRWFIKPDAATSSGASLEYQKQLLRERVQTLRDEAQNGKKTRDELAKLADEVETLDWFREGPNGYYFDQAFFRASTQTYSEVFPIRNGFALCWVEDKRDPQIRPYEECKELVRRRFCNLKADEKKKSLIEQILQDYARTQ